MGIGLCNVLMIKDLTSFSFPYMTKRDLVTCGKKGSYGYEIVLCSSIAGCRVGFWISSGEVCMQHASVGRNSLSLNGCLYVGIIKQGSFKTNTKFLESTESREDS